MGQAVKAAWKDGDWSGELAQLYVCNRIFYVHVPSSLQLLLLVYKTMQ